MGKGTGPCECPTDAEVEELVRWVIASTSLARHLLPPTYLTVVVSLAVLLLVSGSTGATAATDAVLVTVPFLVGRTTIATVADPPSPRSPSAQLTVVPFALQRPWLALADLKRTLRSSVSVRLTPRAVSKPLFLTVTV